MPMRSSSLANNPLAITRELDGRYDVVLQVRDNLDLIEQVAGIDFAIILAELESAQDFTGITVVQGETVAWDAVNKILTVPKGDKGDKGDTGLTGPQGAQGIQGSQGIKGDTGLKGDTGSQGPKGFDGAAGAQGPKGDTGNDLTISQITYNGNGTFNWLFSDGTTYVTPDLRGPKGDTGDQGIKGDQGISVHHIKGTSTTDDEGDFGAYGEIDTYTVYGDANETINLGFFRVNNGATKEGQHGLMYKSTYDTTANGIVDNSEKLEGRTIAQIQADITDTIGASNGIASLDATTKLERAQVPTMNVTLEGDVSGSFAVDGSANVTMTTTIEPNSVALGIDTTGNYMIDIAAGSGISVSHTQGEGSTAIITNSEPNVTTDITTTHNSTDVVVHSSDGTDGTINSATQTLAGVMSTNDKTKLDGIEAGATADQTAAEIKTAYESNDDTNALTNELLTLLTTKKVKNVITDAVNDKLVITYTDDTVANLNINDIITDVHVSGATLDATTNILTLTSTDGGADVIVDLSDFVNSSELTTALNTTVKLTGDQTITGVKTFSSTISGSITGNAATATKLTTARTIGMSGDVSGSATFDGSANVNMTVTVADDSHLHSFANVTNKPTTVSGYGLTDVYTKAEADALHDSLAVASAGQSVLYFLDNVITPGGNYALTNSPDGDPETTIAKIAVAANTPYFMERYISDPIGGTTIDGGLWVFRTYARVSSDVGTSEIVSRINKRTIKSGTVTITGTGTSRTITSSDPIFVFEDANSSILNATLIETPTETFWISAFTSATQVTAITDNSGYVNETSVSIHMYYKLFEVTTGDINGNTAKLYETKSIQPSFNIVPTDSILIAYFAITTSTNKTLTLYKGGTVNYSHIVTPIVYRHNSLKGLNEGEFQHLTTAQLAKINAISGTNTGDQDLSGKADVATTLLGYGITDAYTKTELDGVNVLRADKFLAAQNIAAMVYTDGDLTKIQYNNATDVNYEVLNYTSGNLSSINHYTSGVLKGTTTLSYSSGNLVSAIYA